jgi:hypothetical protein
MESGRAAVWILVVVVLLVGAAASFYLWQKNRAPKPLPSPVVAVATPVPVTPPPATPEPVIVKATPTPAPVVVAATPTPAPTLPPLELATVVRTPALWPTQIKLVQPVAFPVEINGRMAGEVKVPVGTALRLLRVSNQSAVEVDYQNTRRAVPLASTDLMQRALATFRSNGSVLPQAPVAAAAPAATPAPATPASSTAERVKVDVSVERKRVEAGPSTTNAMDTIRASDKYVYEVKVQNRSFGDAPALDLQYLIFVERQKLGERKEQDTIDRITGTAKIDPLNRANKARTVSTSEITLTRQATDYYYVNGGRQKVADNVLGVWVKVFNEGKLIAEYTNPSTVAKRGWDKK